MTKNDFTKLASDKFNQKYRWSHFTQKIMEEVLSVFLDVLIDVLRKDGKITIRDVVSIEVIEYGEPRKAWNPFRHEPMEYRPQKRIRCRFGKRIRDAVNEV